MSAQKVIGGISDAYKAYSAIDKLQTATPGSGGNVSYVGAATTAVNIAGILGSNATEEQKANAIAEKVGLFVADCFTFGITSTVWGLADKYLPGVTGALRKFAANEPVFKAIVGLIDTDEWKTEGNRLKKLIDSGVDIPEALRLPMMLQRGRLKEELIDHAVALDFVGFKEDGTFVNNKFADTREESALTARDIWGYSCFFEKFGNDWLQGMSAQQREAIATKALELGAVQEHRGTIDITWSPDLEAAITEIRGGQPTSTNAAVQSSPPDRKRQ